jgi:hypothetical protein
LKNGVSVMPKKEKTKNVQVNYFHSSAPLAKNNGRGQKIFWLHEILTRANLKKDFLAS